MYLISLFEELQLSKLLHNCLTSIRVSGVTNQYHPKQDYRVMLIVVLVSRGMVGLTRLRTARPADVLFEIASMRGSHVREWSM